MDYSYAAAAKLLQSCPTLCDPIDGSPPGKNTGVGCHFLLQCMKVKVKSLSPVQLLATPWTAAHQAPLSMGFSRQEYWSGVPLPSPYELSVITRILKSKSEVAQSCLTLCDPRTVAHQAPPSMGFSRQEYWSGVPFPSSETLLEGLHFP